MTLPLTSVSKIDHAKQKNQQACVLWFTGLSGAGKSATANAVELKIFIWPAYINSSIVIRMHQYTFAKIEKIYVTMPDITVSHVFPATRQTPEA